MRWTFVKPADGDFWWLVIKNIKQLNEWFEKFKHKYSQAILQDNEDKPEYKQLLTMAKYYSRRDRTSVMAGLATCVGVMYETKLRYLLQGKTLYINEAGGFNTTIKPDITVYRNNLVFPNYTEKDIRISQWGKGEGFHYYAYIGDIEIRSGDTMRWDTYEEAYAVAKKYVTET